MYTETIHTIHIHRYIFLSNGNQSFFYCKLFSRIFKYQYFWDWLFHENDLIEEIPLYWYNRGKKNVVWWQFYDLRTLYPADLHVNLYLVCRFLLVTMINIYNIYICIVHYETNWIQRTAQTMTVFSSLPSYLVILSWINKQPYKFNYFFQLSYVFLIIFYGNKRDNEFWNGHPEKFKYMDLPGCCMKHFSFWVITIFYMKWLFKKQKHKV